MNHDIISVIPDPDEKPQPRVLTTISLGSDLEFRTTLFDYTIGTLLVIGLNALVAWIVVTHFVNHAIAGAQ